GRAGRASPRTGISIDRTPPAGLLAAHTRGRHTAAREGRMEAGMDWQKEMDELRRREALAEELGGLERVRRQHDGGRYTIRERIAKLVDPGTFHELGKIAGRAVYDEKNDLTRFTPSNFVFGRATVDGWEWVVATMGTIPRVALGLGSVAGLGAAHLAAAHYSIMIKEKSALFVAGPPVVERLGQKLTKNQLGGWEIQLRAGAVDDAVDTEEEAFARARRFLSYLPSSIDELPARGPRTDDSERREPWLFEAIPHDVRKPYKMRAIVEALVDKDSFFEISPLYGGAIVTGLARLDGWPVARGDLEERI